LQDDAFSLQKYNFGIFLEGLGMENNGKFWPLGIFYHHLVCRYILRPFGIFCILFPFWYIPRKIWQPCLKFFDLTQRQVKYVTWYR
jgi:hypothetical protein